MAYSAYLNGAKFFDTSTQYDGYMLTKASVDLPAGEAGSFTFSLPPQNIAYNAFNRLIDTVTVYRDSEELFFGRVYSVSGEFNTVQTVTCEGYLAVLNDSIFPPNTYECSLAEYLTAIIENHNEQCPGYPINYGNVSYEDDYIYRELENYECTKDRIDDLIDSYGGYLSARHEGDAVYLDWEDYSEYLDTADQSVDFGENLLDLTQETTADNIITVLIPLGADVTEESEDEDGNAIETTYTVDISSVNDGVMYIEDSDGIGLFGRVWGTYTWDDVTEPSNLLSKAQDYLEEQAKSKVTINVTAVDLAHIDETIEHFAIGTWIHVTSLPHGLDDDFLCTELSFDLLDPSADQLTLGDTREGFVSVSNKSLAANVKLIEQIKANYATNTALTTAVAQAIQTYTSLIEQTSTNILLQVSESYVLQTTYEDGISTTLTSANSYTDSQISLLSDEITLSVYQASAWTGADYVTDGDLSGISSWTASDSAQYSMGASATEGTITFFVYYNLTEEGAGFYQTVTLDDGDYYLFVTAKTTDTSGTVSVSIGDTSEEIDVTSTETQYIIMFEAVEAGDYTLTISNTGDTVVYIYSAHLYMAAKNYLYSAITINADAISAEVTRATAAEEELSASITINADAISAEVTRATAAEEELSASITLTESNILATVAATYATSDTVDALSTSVSTLEQTATSLTSTISTVSDYATAHYGTCSTAAATAAKVVSCDSFSLYTGAIVTVYFTYANTAGSPTLNVNSTGAATIYAYGSTISSSGNYNWDAKSTVTFVYTGSAWNLVESSAFSKIVQTASSITALVEDLEDDVSAMIRITSAGLEVARLVSGAYTTSRTLMDDSGLHILTSDGTELATFESDLIDLGLNSSDSIIRLATGTVTINADSEGGNITVYSADDYMWQMDAYQNNLRFYCTTASGTTVAPVLQLGYSGDITVSNGDVAISDGALTVSGAVTSSSYFLLNGYGVPLYLGSTGGGCIYSAAAQQLHIAASNESSYHLYLGVLNNVWTLAPATSGNLRLGTSSYLWNTVYAETSTISTSDRNKKNSIEGISDQYFALFDQLKPVSYKLNNGESGRTHIGYIAQDVEEAMQNIGMDAVDFAGFCKDENESGGYDYALRYEEFIALNTAAIKALTTRVVQLEQQIANAE